MPTFRKDSSHWKPILRAFDAMACLLGRAREFQGI